MRVFSEECVGEYEYAVIRTRMHFSPIHRGAEEPSKRGARRTVCQVLIGSRKPAKGGFGGRMDASSLYGVGLHDCACLLPSESSQRAEQQSVKPVALLIPADVLQGRPPHRTRSRVTRWAVPRWPPSSGLE